MVVGVIAAENLTKILGLGEWMEGGGGGNLLLSSFPCFGFSSTPRFCVLWKLDLSAGYGYPCFFKNPWIREDLYSREFLLSLLLLLQRQMKKSR